MKKTLTLFIAGAFCLPALNVNAGENGLSFKEKLEFAAPNALRGSDGANGPGVIQIGLGWGATLGGAKITSKYSTLTNVENGVGINSNLGLRVQYGLADLFSAGIFVRRENAAYVTSDANSNSSTVGTNGFGFGLEAKIYPVNKEKFTLYAAPRIGFSTSKTNFYGSNASNSIYGTANGLNYGFTAGFNWYWAKFIGMSLDLGYSGSALNGKFNDAILKDDTYKLNNGGFFIGFGLISRFGG